MLAEVDFRHSGASLFPSHQARYFCSLVVQVIASDLVFFSVGVIGAKLLSSYVSQHSIFRNCNAGIPSLLGKLSFLRNDVISVSFIPMIIYFPGIDFSAIRLYNNW